MNLNIKIKIMPHNSHFRAGRKDIARRWYPARRFQVPSTFQVRSPSRQFPDSYIRHFYTKKYAKQLLIYEPKLYMKMHDIKPGHPDYIKLIGYVFAREANGEIEADI